VSKPKQIDPIEAAAALNADGKASDVKASNYSYLVRCYGKVHGKPGRFGSNLNPIDHSSQWGAWRAYLKAKHLPYFHMDQVGQRLSNLSKPNRESVCGYLAPCDWPADFDADWDAANDRYAGDRFVDAQTKKREEVAQLASMSVEEKQAVIKRAMAKFTN
jgi:hypothetical protein